MKVIIAGTRTFNDYELLKKAISESGFEIEMVLSGCAKGADKLGERWAEQYQVPTEHHPADWAKNGKAAGILRNHEMVRRADALIAFWDGKSAGTKDVISFAKRLGRKVHVQMFTPSSDKTSPA